MAKDRVDVTENMTLGEMYKRDVDNLTLVQKSKKTKEYAFDSKEDALIWLDNAIQVVLLKFGIDKKGTIEKAKRVSEDDLDFRRFLKNFEEKGGKPISHNNRHFLYAAHCLNKAQDAAGIRTEMRRYQDPKEVWRSGFYIIYENEIAYFFSNVYRRKGGHYTSGNIIVPAFGKFFVLTNYIE